MGTRSPPALESDQNASGLGAMASKGTSTRDALFAARPIRASKGISRSSGNGVSSSNANAESGELTMRNALGS